MSRTSTRLYDLVFVGGDAVVIASIAALRVFDAAERTLAVGRPQLDHSYPGALPGPATPDARVVRADLGGRPAEHCVRVVPVTACDHRGAGLPTRRSASIYDRTRGPEYASRKHRGRQDCPGTARKGLATTIVDRDSYGWQCDFADACITRYLRLVAYDWLPTGKPLVIHRAGAKRLPPTLAAAGCPSAAGC